MISTSFNPWIDVSDKLNRLKKVRKDSMFYAKHAPGLKVPADKMVNQLHEYAKEIRTLKKELVSMQTELAFHGQAMKRLDRVIAAF